MSLEQAGATAVPDNTIRWLWVLACARTTVRMGQAARSAPPWPVLRDARKRAPQDEVVMHGANSDLVVRRRASAVSNHEAPLFPRRLCEAALLALPCACR